MKTKQIVFTKAYTAQLLEVECAPPMFDEVMVELEYSAISAGTEKANYIGERNNIYLAENESSPFPRTVGYSSAGRIVGLGAGVTELKVGDKVALFGSEHKKHVVINRKNLVKIPDGVSTAEAAMAYISVFPLAAIRKTKIEIGESALVMGLGILGIFAVEQLRAAGAYPIIAADPLARRRDMALRLGADYALDPTEADFVDKVKEICGGVNVCIEVSGVGAGLVSALDCMKRFGRVALLGCTRHSDFTVDYYTKVHGPGISLIGAHTLARPAGESSSGLWTAADDIKAVLALIGGGRLNFKDVISEIDSPADAQAVYDRLVSDRGFPVGVLFDWSKI